MKIAFVQTEINEYFGPMVISSVLKRAGHEVDLFIPKLENNFNETLKKFKPDLVANSTMTGIHIQDLKILNLVKSLLPDVLTIMGGIHPTFLPEVVESPNLDIVCRGEGERAVIELAEKIETGKDYTKIKNLWVKKNGSIIKNDIEKTFQDLSCLPPPDREIYCKYQTFIDNPSKRFMAARGCPFDCTFCFNHKYLDLYKKSDGKRARGYVRIIEPEKFIKEIKDVKNKYGLKTVQIVDDIFIIKKDWFEKFAEIFPREVGLQYNCYVRADLVTENMALKLKNSGCRVVHFGVESGNETIRQKILKKSLSDDAIINATKILKRHNIMFQTTNMLGLPGETIDDAISTIKINSKIKADFAWSCLYQPIPGTELTEKAIEMKLLDVPIKWDYLPPSGFQSSILIYKKDIKQFENIHKLFYLGFVFPKLLPFIKFISRFNFLRPLFSLFFLSTHAIQTKNVYNFSLRYVFKRGIDLLDIFKNDGGLKKSYS